MTESNAGRITWYELMTTNPAGAIAFYSEVIGWKTQVWGADYTMWLSSQGPLGGAMTLPEPAQKMGAPPHWMASVQVADVDRTVAKVRELGGAVYLEPRDLPEIGRYAVLADPQGAVLSVIAPAREMPAPDSTKHGEFCWSELITTDQNAAMAFYQTIFGWERLLDHDMGPMGVYVIYGRKGQQLGGIFAKPKDSPMPTAFLHYVQVDDLEAAITRAKNSGGKLVHGPMEVPGGARIAQLMDPQGAMFALHVLAKPAS